ncbi:hypothetical protein BuS5_03350 [Desulfosarcina sp. BuS5]|nr:hypothetical protein BuS5_03350 [Desulfosarcina sp. BuS5]
MMKKLYVFPLLIFSVFFVFSLSSGEVKEDLKTPDSFFPEESFDFGKVVDGTQITHDFKVLNRGNAPLVVKRVKTG